MSKQPYWKAKKMKSAMLMLRKLGCRFHYFGQSNGDMSTNHWRGWFSPTNQWIGSNALDALRMLGLRCADSGSSFKKRRVV